MLKSTRIERLEGRLLFATFTVTTAADAGAGSFRQAIIDSNAAAGTDTIAFAIPGGGVQTIAPASPLPDISDDAGTSIDARTQPGFAAGAPTLTLDGGSGGGAVGLNLIGGNTVVQGLAIQNFSAAAIQTSGAGNHTLFANVLLGGAVAVEVDSPNIRIGGASVNDRNVVAGISINATGSGAIIENNRIGTDFAGTAALSPASPGISVGGGSLSGIQIVGNLVSGASGAGIDLFGATNTVIQGNTIGANADGTAALTNGGNGIVVDNSSATSIVNNLISGNASGILVASADTVILGNKIGTNTAGTAAIANSVGIILGGALRPSIVNNLISGNTSHGIEVADGVSDMVIQQNRIGINNAGTGALGNGGSGIQLGDTSAGTSNDALIGGAGASQGNIIAFNGGPGVNIPLTGVGNSILGNSIFSNTGIGIDLASANFLTPGRTPNDADDSDAGPNNTQNFPVLTEATGTTVSGTLTSVASVVFRIEFFADPAGSAAAAQGRTFLGATDVTTNSSGVATFSATLANPAPTGQFITATATNGNGSTSEFSDPIVSGATGPDLQVLGNDVAIASGDTTATAGDFTAFGAGTVGGTAVTRVFTLTNNGLAAINFSGATPVTLSGPNAAQFAVTDQPNATLNPGQSTTITIDFSAAAAGNQAATVSIASNDPDDNPFTFAISGQGTTPTPAPEIEVSGDGNFIASGDDEPGAEDATNFGTATIGAAPVTRTFTISNAGLQNLSIGAITFAGTGAGQFSVSQAPAATVAAGGDTTFVVSFTPVAGGQFPATVSIANNDADENPYTFALLAVGVSGAGEGPTAVVLPQEQQPMPVLNDPAYSFIVRYTDPDGLSASSFDSSDLVVTGPNGFSAPAEFVSIQTNSVTQVDVVYRIAAPGGTLDSADEGTYTVTLQSNAVLDSAGNPADAGAIGTFALSLDAPRTPVGEVGLVNGKRQKLTFTEPDGTVVTISLSNGAGSVFQGTDGRFDLDVTSSNGKLTVTAKGGNGRAEMDDVVITGSLKSLAAKTGDLTGVVTGGGLSAVILGSTSGVTISTASILTSLNILGAASNTQVFSGALLGSDGRFGGAGAAADTAFGAGEIRKINIRGAVNDSLFAAGLDPVDGILLNDNGVIVGGATSRIRSLKITGPVDADTTFAAGAFPKRASLGGQRVDPLTDSRFDTTP